MIQKKRTMITLGVVVLCLCLSMIETIPAADQVPISGEPTVSQIIIDPQEPVVMSNVTFTATIFSDNPLTDVRIIMQECKENLCYLRNNESMTKINATTYQRTIPLIKDDANHIQYRIEIESNGEWHTYPWTNATLKTDDGTSDGNGTNGNGSHTKTPGFEVPLFIIAVGILMGIGILYLERKRLR